MAMSKNRIYLKSFFIFYSILMCLFPIGYLVSRSIINVQYSYFSIILLISSFTILYIKYIKIYVYSNFKISKINKNAIYYLLVVSILIYLFGFISKIYGIGRVISFIVLYLNIGLASKIVKTLPLIRNKMLHRYLLYLSIPLLITFHIPSVALRSYYGFNGQRNHYDSYTGELLSIYEDLNKYVNQYDVVISDINTSWKIPAFSGKIIASNYPTYWVENHQERRDDLISFFSFDSNIDSKWEFIQKYNAQYIFLNNHSDSTFFNKFGNLLYQNKGYSLIKIVK